jgi:hypothetical protein
MCCEHERRRSIGARGAEWGRGGGGDSGGVRVGGKGWGGAPSDGRYELGGGDMRAPLDMDGLPYRM